MAAEKYNYVFFEGEEVADSLKLHPFVNYLSPILRLTFLSELFMMGFCYLEWPSTRHLPKEGICVMELKSQRRCKLTVYSRKVLSMT